MKKLLIILISGLLFQSCNSSREQKDKHFDNNDLDKGNLNGNLKSYKEYLYEEKDTLIDITKGTKYCSRFIIFNKNGNVTASFQYRFNGKIDAKSNFIYDGNLLIEDNSESCFYEINKFKSIYKYNNYGKLIDNISYNGKLELKFSGETKTIYNEKGAKIKEEFYNYAGILDEYKTFEYDTRGNEIGIKWYMQNDLVNITNKKYDEYSNEIESVTISPLTNNEYKRLFKYDSNNNIIEKVIRDSEYKTDDIYTYYYAYDKNENWINKTTSKNDKITSIIERKYEYAQ